MGRYVQIIEMKTSHIDEVEALVEERRGEGTMPMERAVVTADRDRPGYYLSILEFDSYEAAMENSRKPETDELASKMAALMDEPPKFYNLDVRRIEER
jgi:hypothetical protein